jgi:hypothetical protein
VIFSNDGTRTILNAGSYNTILRLAQNRERRLY